VVVGFVVDHDDAGMYFSNFKVCIKLQINKFKTKPCSFQIVLSLERMKLDHVMPAML